MNPRRGLIGFFIFLFLLSGISLITLVIDDKKDLSSLASTGVSSGKQPPLAGISTSENLQTYQALTAKGIPVNFRYDSTIWLAPSPNDKDNVFVNRKQLYSVRVLPKEDISESTIGKILGPNFVFVKKISATPLNSNWMINSYLYKFFGQEKTVEYWQGSANYSLLVVLSQNATHEDVVSFAQYLLGEKVKGVSTTQDDSARLTALSRPSVVLVLTNYCSKAKFGNIPGTTLTNKEYPFCLSATGTGFFVNSNGYIATNGHVVKIGPQTALLAGVTTGQFNDLLIDYTQAYLQQTGITLPRDQVAQKVTETIANKEGLYQMAGAIDVLLNNNLLTISGDNYKYFIQAGNTPIQVTKSGSVNTGNDIIEGQLIGLDYQEPSDKIGFTSSDVALIKVSGNNYPALPLGSLTDVSSGEEIQIIGFPGIAGANDSILLDTSANAEPTITRGVVSALKKAKGNQKNLIQTDASINHGNSGGPAIDSNGNVIGIATYGLVPEEGGGNYNFLRDIGDLKDLMAKYNITSDVGPTYKEWQNGLNNYWLSYFKYAKTNFSKVKELYPIHPTVDKYLSAATKLINTPSDQTPIFTRNQRRIFMAISGSVMLASVLGIIIVFISGKYNRPKQNIIENGLTPVQTF